jgi:hypothetical protein
METFNSFEEEKQQKDQLPQEAKWLHKVLEDEKMWKMDEPSILFTANIMDKIKTKQRPIFHKGVIWLFGIIWTSILVLAVAKAIPTLKPTSWQLPTWDTSQWSKFFSFEANASLLMLANMILAVWVFFLINRFLQNKSYKKVTKL